MISYGTAPPSPRGEGKLTSLAGETIALSCVGNAGTSPIKVSAKTDGTGAFHFDKLPAGEYELKVRGLPDQLLTVGSDGIAGGKLTRGSDGIVNIQIFLNTNITSKAPRLGGGGPPAGIRVTNSVGRPLFGLNTGTITNDDVGVARNPVEFGSGNTPGSGPAGGGMGLGMSPPGAGGPSGPMAPGPGGPGPGGPMSGPGGPMSPGSPGIH